ncbi:MAG: 50S ribosomal protein L4 [Elusimicrobia bacterium]|nr:50S ribosomal protein L4 [Elusimicrobiota bacterium]
MNIPVLDMQGKKIEALPLPEHVASLKVSVPLLHEVVSSYMANQRSGLASAKTRAEVSGGGAKPWKQKHTGRARHGSIRSPLWRKGGVVFGPKPRSYRKDIPRKKIRSAIRMTVKEKVSTGDAFVIKELKMEGHRTKELFSLLNKLGINGRKTLLVFSEPVGENIKLAARNLNFVKITPANSLNAYDVLNADKLIFIGESAMGSI